jgi:hypothetical protein
MRDGENENETEGDRIFITTLSLAEPPDPVQVIVSVADDTVAAVVDTDPLGLIVPDHPPEAVQEVAFVDIQVITAELL